LELRDKSSDGKKYAFGGTSKELTPEMRGYGYGDELAAVADSDLQSFGFGIFSNAISGIMPLKKPKLPAFCL